MKKSHIQLALKTHSTSKDIDPGFGQYPIRDYIYLYTPAKKQRPIHATFTKAEYQKFFTLHG